MVETGGSSSGAPGTPGAVVAAALAAPPGPDTVAALAAVDLAALDHEGRLDWVEAWERASRWMSARAAAALAAVEAGAPAGPRGQFVVEEVGFALRLSPGAAGHRLASAR